MRWRIFGGLVFFLYLICASGSIARASGNFQINIEPGPALQANPDAMAAFNTAANAWSSRITSAFPVTINISADTVDLGSPLIIGQTTFGTYNDLNQPYDLVRNLMAARAARPGDAVLGLLPTSANVSAHIPASYTTTGGQQVNFAFDSQHLGILTANQKALGIINGTNSGIDGTIQFNTGFAFEYNGVAQAGKMDFITVATHEIGHVLGFTSDVDDFDDAKSRNNSLTDDLTTLDLFRFNTAEIPTALNFTTAPRELRFGQEAVTHDLTNTWRMSTGFNFGDGNQASHWKADEQTGNFIGVMDPTLDYGTIETIQPSDLRAMELIGYDTVPEPAGIALLGIACVGLLRRARGRTWSAERGA